MAWTPEALSCALCFKEIFPDLGHFGEGIEIDGRHTDLLVEVCRRLFLYVERNVPGYGLKIVAVESLAGRLCVSVFPDDTTVDAFMSSVRHNSAKSRQLTH